MTLVSAAGLAFAAMWLGGVDASTGQVYEPLPQDHSIADNSIEQKNNPVVLEIAYTSDLISNVSGGIRKGTRYLDNVDIALEADMDSLVGWNGARIHASGLYNNGRSFSDLTGDSQIVSNLEAGSSLFRLYEAWVEQSFGNKISVLAGLYDLNSEFDVIDSANLFVSSAHGIGTDLAQTGENGPSIFPSTSLAARISIQPAENWVIRAAVLDGVPDDPARPNRTIINLGNGDGALVIGEIEAPFSGGKLLVGHWRYTADFDYNDGISTGSGNNGCYIRAEIPFSTQSDRTTIGYLRLGTASGRFNMFDKFVNSGIKFSGWIPGRSGDEFGFGIAAAFTSQNYRAAKAALSSEVAVEATYLAQITPWFAIQPNIHYIHQPSADRNIPDAFVIGLRAKISLSSIGF